MVANTSQRQAIAQRTVRDKSGVCGASRLDECEADGGGGVCEPERFRLMGRFLMGRFTEIAVVGSIGSCWNHDMPLPRVRSNGLPDVLGQLIA